MVSIDETLYRSKWETMVNVLKYSDLNIARIAKYNIDDNRQADVIFAVHDNPEPTDFYPKLIKQLMYDFPYGDARVIDNIVELNLGPDGTYKLLLLPINEFDKKIGKDVEYVKLIFK